MMLYLLYCVDVVGMDSVFIVVVVLQYDFVYYFVCVCVCSLQLVVLFSVEDVMLQSMVDVSFSKWYLVYIIWFFECFVLVGFVSVLVYDLVWDYFFNSYYKSIGLVYVWL